MHAQNADSHLLLWTMVSYPTSRQKRETTALFYRRRYKTYERMGTFKAKNKMLKLFVFLGILAGSTIQYDVTSFFDLISITGEWSHCCNDRFLAEYVWELARNNTNLCLETFPEDRVCFDYCWTRYFRALDKNNEFIRSKLLWYLGKGAMLGDEKD